MSPTLIVVHLFLSSVRFSFLLVFASCSLQLCSLIYTRLGLLCLGGSILSSLCNVPLCF